MWHGRAATPMCMGEAESELTSLMQAVALSRAGVVAECFEHLNSVIMHGLSTHF
jgi:hypothetical protein